MKKEQRPDLPKNQREFIAYFNKKNKIKMNPELFRRSDDDIIEELKKVIMSCERCNEFFRIRVNGFTVVDDYTEIQTILYNNYENAIRNKSKSKKKDNPYAGINLNQSDIRLLIVEYFVEIFNKNSNIIFPFASKPLPTEETFKVIIAVPRIVDKFYIRINGIMRSTLYQIVDGSTYNNSNSNSKIPNISFKIVFMAARVFRYYYEAKLAGTDETYKLTHYMSNIFTKTVSGCKYILAKFGFKGAIEFLGLNDIYITDTPIYHPDMYCFERAENLYVSAPRYLVDNDLMTQTFISSVLSSLIPGMDYLQCYDDKFWVRSLGGDFNNTPDEKMLIILEGTDITVTDTYSKGNSILDSFENIYDIGTKESIRLPEDQKATMYHILRWILREFNALRVKNNLDVSIKKIRFPEYIASIYAIKIARGIYRVADQNSKITTSAIRRAIKTDPLFLVNSIAKSNLVAYRNIVTDMDSFIALKFTYKGIAGLGEKSDKSIPKVVRYIYPSHVGRLDLDSSSDTNPGITGTISPFTTLYDKYFSDYEEPHSWEEKYAEVFKQYKEVERSKQLISFRSAVLEEGNTEEFVIKNEVCAAMRQVLEPHLYSGYGEFLEPLYMEEPYDEELDILHILT